METLSRFSQTKAWARFAIRTRSWLNRRALHGNGEPVTSRCGTQTCRSSSSAARMGIGQGGRQFAVSCVVYLRVQTPDFPSHLSWTLPAPPPPPSDDSLDRDGHRRPEAQQPHPHRSRTDHRGTASRARTRARCAAERVPLSSDGVVGRGKKVNNLLSTFLGR